MKYWERWLDYVADGFAERVEAILVVKPEFAVRRKILPAAGNAVNLKPALSWTS